MQALKALKVSRTFFNVKVKYEPNGSGNAANATQIAVLEAVTGLSADDIVGDDNSQTTV